MSRSLPIRVQEAVDDEQILGRQLDAGVNWAFLRSQYVPSNRSAPDVLCLTANYLSQSNAGSNNNAVESFLEAIFDSLLPEV